MVINRILEPSQTPIMSLYRNFGSKDGLAAAYLERRSERNAEEVNAEVQRREMILATFDVLTEALEPSDYRGCPFINATVEMASPDNEVVRIARRIKEAVRQSLAELTAAAGAPDPAGLSLQLNVLLDGASAAAVLYRDSSGASHARAAAETLIDAALASGPASHAQADAHLGA